MTESPSSYSTKATFPITFSNTNYVIIGIPLQDDADPAKYYALTMRCGSATIAFCYFRTPEPNVPAAYYLAIGN